MYVIAIIADLLGAIPIVNMVVFPVAAAALYTAGKTEGVNIFGPDMIGRTFVVMFLKFMPGLSTFALFAWTARVFLAKRQAAKKHAS